MQQSSVTLLQNQSCGLMYSKTRSVSAGYYALGRQRWAM
jgi:hypothetical protein